MGYIEDIRRLVGTRPIILVGAVTVIVDEVNRILLQQRTSPNGFWGIPGGLMELGETTEDAARREVFEETGLIIEELHLINIFSGPDKFVKAENGDEFYTVTAAYYTKKIKGQLANKDKTESIALRFFHPNEFPEQIVKSHREILNEYLRLGEFDESRF